MADTNSGVSLRIRLWSGVINKVHYFVACQQREIDFGFIIGYKTRHIYYRNYTFDPRLDIKIGVETLSDNGVRERQESIICDLVCFLILGGSLYADITCTFRAEVPMNAASELLTESLTSTFRESNCLESDESSSGCFNQKIYELREVEELASLRTLGYSKPKHMWILKDQALSGVANISNLSTLLPSDHTTSSSNSLCLSTNTDHDDDRSSTSSSYLVANISTSQSLVLPGRLSISATTDKRQQSNAVMSLEVDTSSNSCNHFPSMSMEYRNGTSGKCSSHLSPNPLMPVIPQSTRESTNPNIFELVGSEKKLTYEEDKSTPKPPMADHPESMINSEVSERTTVLNGESSITSKSPHSYSTLDMEAKASQKLNTGSVKHARIKRANQPQRKKVQNKALSLIVLKPSTSSSSASQASSLTSSTSDESLNHQMVYDCDTSGSPPLNSSFGVGGLKIRLRRDSTPIDIPVHRRKRTKAKHDSAGTFRIVESWCDTDAPGGDFSQRVRSTISSGSLPSSSISSSSSSPSLAITNGSLRVGDIVWAKLAGYPYWPSRISAIWARTAHQLNQACTLMPTPSISSTSSLAVMATPADSSLASGYTARVEWLAWDQWSYLSCAKLFPFLDAYEKLYSPRTRVKGYTDAIRLAKQYSATQMSSSMAMSQEGCFSPVPALMTTTTTTPIQTPAHNDGQWSTSAAALSCSSSEPLSSLPSLQRPNSREPIDSIEVDSVLIPPQGQHSVGGTTGSNTNSSSLDGVKSSLKQSQSLSLEVSVSELDFLDVSVDNLAALSTDFNLPCGGGSNTSASWAPLPQLDISGFGDFVCHIPTFSEDEDEEDIGKQLALDLGS